MDDGYFSTYEEVKGRTYHTLSLLVTEVPFGVVLPQSKLSFRPSLPRGPGRHKPSMNSVKKSNLCGFHRLRETKLLPPGTCMNSKPLAKDIRGGI